jgi:hypothetical protein
VKKMPCLFKRDHTDPRRPVLLREVTPGCEWVLAGEGTASRKWDGTACAVIGGVLYKRYDAKRDPRTSQFRTPPEGAVPCCDPDPVTGHWPHWVPVRTDRPEDRHHVAARCAPNGVLSMKPLPDGTYELVGPSVNGNPERIDSLQFKRHGDVLLPRLPRQTLASPPYAVDFMWHLLRLTLSDLPWEGLVFAHPDGRMCKIRRVDFGLTWPIEFGA